MSVIWNLLKSQFPGRDNPFGSATFWAMVFVAGVPNAVAEYFGIELGDFINVDRVAAFLAILGLRRKK